MFLSLFHCQFRHINYVTINIVTFVVCWWGGHFTGRISGSLCSWRIDCRFLLWCLGWFLMTADKIRLESNRYHRWYRSRRSTGSKGIQYLSLRRCDYVWQDGRVLLNRRCSRRISDYLIWSGRCSYHRRCWLVAILALRATTVALSYMKLYGRLPFPPLHVSSTTFVAPTNTRWTSHDQCNGVAIVLCACYFVCWWVTKCESKSFGATLAVVFEFQYQGKRLRTRFLFQYNPKQVLKMALFEKDQKFTVHISQLQTKISKNEIYPYILLNLQNVVR